MTNTPFQTMAEVDRYLSGDTVECLVCRKAFSSLNANHLRSHGITHDEYRIRFGIPFKRSLTSAPFREKSRAAASPQQIERLLRAQKAMIESIASRSPRRPLAPAVVNRMRKNGTTRPGGVMAEPACLVCGCEIVTAGLAVLPPLRCGKCATLAAQKSRESYWHKKAVAESEKDPIVQPPFETAAEVDDYLSEDTITCLICEARLQRLDKHLSMHRMSADEYRVRFNIPFDRSLMSAPCRARVHAYLVRMDRSQYTPDGRWQTPCHRKLDS